MIQVIQRRQDTRPSKGKQFSDVIQSGLETVGNHFNEQRRQQQEERQYQEENEAAKRQGIDLSGIRNPKIREKGFELAAQGKTKGQLDEREAAQNTAAKKFADELVKNNPNSPMHRTVADIYRSDLPMEDKATMVKSLTGIDPFKVDQQQRLEKDMLRKVYSNKIKELQDQLKSARPSERGAILQQLATIQAERDSIFFGEEVEKAEEDELFREEGGVKKVKFNNKNPEHKAKAEQLYKKYGDLDKVREILSKEFKA